ncbi:hypothetical protein K435DRAFT_959507 [Dendrothele bispora CBS 962.96]|uniref:WD40 repeat-like protein n=1 Tax=Dendrothele bispora (strain CBS 962.96) TaxID=1314807 RepID=A0A4S8MXU1_DENBC|nr:hypothetical protein K435DRAFT_959507 [Dendrothele bispora CBS 962.96]
MDLTHQHPTNVAVLSCSHTDDAPDLVAVGGEHSVQVLLIKKDACELVALFHIGTRVTALAWSPRTISPSSSDDWLYELVAAGSDFSLHFLTKTSSESENVFHFGGGLSGHHGKINGMTFCGGSGEDASRYVATVSDDKMLMVWDLYPPDSNNDTSSMDPNSPSFSRSQPTAYAIPFPHPLTSINSHPSSSKEFLVSDCRGSIFLTDWRSDPGESPDDSSNIVELSEPRALSDASLGLALHLSGSVAWHRGSADMVGAVYGSKYAVWDISKLQGGKPSAVGTTFSQGGNKFRWCDTHPEYFAISTQSPLKGAIIQVYNSNFLSAHAQPTVFSIAPRPHFVQDFDFVTSGNVPTLAVAVGRSVFVFPIGAE